MKYLYMRPCELRKALENNTPAVLPLGVVEYHAEHLPFGLDCFTCIEAIERMEKRHPETIVLPPFYYGAASRAVASPKNNGTIHVDAEAIVPVAKEIFRGLLQIGFRNVRCFVAHQTECFNQGMPTDLAFRLAARQAIFEFLEKESGEGWWGNEKFASYYSSANNPFNWITVHPIRSREQTQRDFPGDHAGKLETSEAMVICPDCVKMNDIDDSIWFSRAGHDATAEWGDAALTAASMDIEKICYPDK
ncbi:MAG: creatininase family protein [Victivallaceae bacterium]|nr:creatininase family protein [Victivallaceae bacterium]